MWKYIFLCILIVQILCQSEELKLPVNPGTQERLSEALQKLSDELQNFRTLYENKVNLYRRVTIAEEYLQQVRNQVSQYDNVLVGQQNNVQGCKNIILGSFNTIKGSNNYAFIQKYNGQANGDLLLGKWRIDIQNKNLILINPSSAISFLNEEFNRKYLRYLTRNNGGFGYGTNLGQNTVILMKDNLNEDLFDGGKRVSYGSTGMEYKANNEFQYGVSNGLSPGIFGSINIDDTSQKQNNQQSSFTKNYGFGQQQPQLVDINPVFIAHIPLSPSDTYIQPQVLALKSTEFLSEIQKNIQSLTSATRYLPQPDSFIIPGPIIMPQYPDNSFIPQTSISEKTQTQKNNEGYQNQIFYANPFNLNFGANLRKQILSNNHFSQTNYLNPINFGSSTVLTTNLLGQNVLLNQFPSNNQQNPQINLLTQKTQN